MAPKMIERDHSAHIAYNTTTTAAAELRYEKASFAVELLARDEELRKTRLRNMLLGHEIDDLNEKLCEEFERGDNAELDAQTWQASAVDMTEQLERLVNETRIKTRELELLKAELASLQDVSADSTKLLTEKLALSRELAHLKPELEHLRSQANSNDGILTEKLSLQRQLSALQAELDNEKRTVQRLSGKQNKTAEQSMQYEAQLDELKKELAKEQRDRQKAERAVGQASEEQVDELKKELVKEKRERQKSETVARKAHEEKLEELKKELAQERRDREKLEKSESKAGVERLDEVQKELAKEKRDHQKNIKDARSVEIELNNQKAVLEDKLDQFRTKLRTTKEKLKETEAELVKAQAAVVARPTATTEAKAKNPRKRAAVQIDPDAAIGTPGDAHAAKRNKRAPSVIGEKSTFSITPFLNRTASVAPESPPKAVEDDDLDADEPVASIENATSPSASRARPSTATNKTSSILGRTSSNKNSSKPAAAPRQKVASSMTLEKVTEEGEADDDAENAPPAATTTTTAQAHSKAMKPVLKPKSLTSFASFRDASLPPQQMPKKKQKILGGVPKTIFDEDEEGEEGVLSGASAKIALGGRRAFGAFGGRGFGGISLLQPKTKGPLTLVADGFMFSPLKKDRKAMAAAAASAQA